MESSRRETTGVHQTHSEKGIRQEQGRCKMEIWKRRKEKRKKTKEDERERERKISKAQRNN